MDHRAHADILAQGGAEFLSEAELRIEKPFKCHDCGKGFATPAYLGQHRRIHSGHRPYGPCQWCGKRFIQLSHLQQHVRTHTGERPYKCPVQGCTKAFAQLSNLNSHTRRHQRDPRWVPPRRGSAFSEPTPGHSSPALSHPRSLPPSPQAPGLSWGESGSAGPSPSPASESPSGGQGCVCVECGAWFAEPLGLASHRQRRHCGPLHTSAPATPTSPLSLPRSPAPSPVLFPQRLNLPSASSSSIPQVGFEGLQLLPQRSDPSELGGSSRDAFSRRHSVHGSELLAGPSHRGQPADFLRAGQSGAAATTTLGAHEALFPTLSTGLVWDGRAAGGGQPHQHHTRQAGPSSSGQGAMQFGRGSLDAGLQQHMLPRTGTESSSGLDALQFIRGAEGGGSRPGPDLAEAKTESDGSSGQAQDSFAHQAGNLGPQALIDASEYLDSLLQ